MSDTKSAACVIGYPAKHSRSPMLHGYWIKRYGIDAEYRAEEVAPADIEEFIQNLKKHGYVGANVTMPHKRLAASLADRCAAEATRAGAVNTLVRVGAEVIGHNTDIAGIRHAAAARDLPRGPVLVLGAGGAAAAALLAFEGRPLSVSARRADQAAALIDELDVEAEVVPWGEPRAGFLLVNATAIGMQGEPLPFDHLAEHSGLLDMPYAAGPTRASTVMRAAGRAVADGPDMLLGQAVGAFRLWTGMRPDEHAMRLAMEAASPG